MLLKFITDSHLDVHLAALMKRYEVGTSAKAARLALVNHEAVCSRADLAECRVSDLEDELFQLRTLVRDRDRLNGLIVGMLDIDQ